MGAIHWTRNLGMSRLALHEEHQMVAHAATHDSQSRLSGTRLLAGARIAPRVCGEDSGCHRVCFTLGDSTSGLNPSFPAQSLCGRKSRS
jgi:hypothetical protein